MQSAYCAPARRLEMCWWWMALLSLASRWGRMKHETKQNLFRYIQIEKMCFYVKQVNWLNGGCVGKLKQKQNG